MKRFRFVRIVSRGRNNKREPSFSSAKLYFEYIFYYKTLQTCKVQQNFIYKDRFIEARKIPVTFSWNKCCVFLSCPYRFLDRQLFILNY